MEGWVKLWRQSIKKGWLKNHKLWVFWTYCLMKASGIDTQEINSYNQVKLKRGQFIFGLNKASKEINMSVRSLRTCLVHLQKWGNIDKQSDNQFSIITILNYNTYNNSNMKTTSKTTSKRQASDKQATTLKKDKKEKKVNMTSPSARSSDLEFIEFLKNNVAYKHINIDIELGKMDAWISTHRGKQKTRRFIVNWLNRIDKPIDNKPKGTVINRPL